MNAFLMLLIAVNGTSALMRLWSATTYKNQQDNIQEATYDLLWAIVNLIFFFGLLSRV